MTRDGIPCHSIAYNSRSFLVNRGMFPFKRYSPLSITWILYLSFAFVLYLFFLLAYFVFSSAILWNGLLPLFCLLNSSFIILLIWFLFKHMGDSPKSVNFQAGKNNFLKVIFSGFFPWNPLLRCPWGQKCSSAQFILKVKGYRAVWNFSDQINGIPFVWYLKNQPDRWNSIDLVPKKSTSLMEFHRSGTWKVSHQIKSNVRTRHSAQRHWAARSTYRRKTEK